MGSATAFFLGPAPLGPWVGVKRSKNILLQLQSHFQRFLYQCHAPGMELWGAGVPRWSIIYIFFKHGHVAYQIDEDDEDDKQNRMQVKFLS